jgi:uncharacterized protein YndB with AHSA1/START domain
MPRRHVHEESFPVAPARLFAALLAPSAIRRWWNASRAIVLPERGGVFAVCWGASEDAPDYATVATLRVYEPPHRFVLGDYRYRAATGALPFQADFETEFAVSASAEGATLRVTQAGFPDDPAADEFLAACRRGWSDTFAGLRRHLQTPPEGDVDGSGLRP